MIYDFIISGGGAIGSYLGFKLSQKGYQVLILERNKKPGKLACSGLVSERIWQFIPYKKNLIENEINGARIWIDKKEHKFKGKVLALNRPKLDRFLANLANKSGVEYLLGHQVIDLREGKSTVKVLAKSRNRIKEFRTKVLAGCDGTNSITRIKAKLPLPKTFLLGIMGYAKEKRSNKVDLYFSRLFPGFFAWRIPRSYSGRGKGTMEYGLALNPSIAKERFEIFMKRSNLRVRNIHAAFIPILPPSKVTSKRVFLCGDAAAQVKPWTGGGLIYGLTCADIASQVINPKNPNLEKYEKFWRKKLGKEIFIGKLIKKSYYLPNFIKNFLLFCLRSKHSHRPLDMDNPSSIFF